MGEDVILLLLIETDEPHVRCALLVPAQPDQLCALDTAEGIIERYHCFVDLRRIQITIQ